MNARTTFWRRGLAALGLVACLALFLVAMNAESVGQDGHGHGHGHGSIEIKQTDSPFVPRDGDREHAEREHGDRDHADHDHGDHDHDHDGDEGHQHDDGDRDDDHAEHRDREHRARDQARHEDEVHALSREREELRERMGQVDRELHGLRDGQDEEARELRNAMEEIRNRLGHLDRELGDGERDRPRERDVHPLVAERNALQERAGDIERRVHQLGDHDGEDAQAIRRESERAMDDIRERVAQINRELDHGERGRERERAEGEREISGLLREVLGLQEQGFEVGMAKRLLDEDEPEKAQQLRHEMEEIGHRINQVVVRHFLDGPPEEFLLEMHHHQIELLRRAARRFAEAGKPDMAEENERHANELAEQLEVAARDREHPEARPGPEDLGPAIHEIRQQMNEMRREMAEMREMMQQLLERS